MLAAFLLLGMAAVGVKFLLWPKQPTLPAIGSEFLGFTDMPQGLAARFSITNYLPTQFSWSLSKRRYTKMECGLPSKARR